MQNHAPCAAGADPQTQTHITDLRVLGRTLTEDAPVTATLTQVRETGDNWAMVRTEIRIEGDLNGTDGQPLYSGPLAER